MGFIAAPVDGIVFDVGESQNVLESGRDGGIERGSPRPDPAPAQARSDAKQHQDKDPRNRARRSQSPESIKPLPSHLIIDSLPSQSRGRCRPGFARTLQRRNARTSCAMLVSVRGASLSARISSKTRTARSAAARCSSARRGAGRRFPSLRLPAGDGGGPGRLHRQRYGRRDD